MDASGSISASSSIIDAQEPEQPEPTKPPKLPKETGLKAIRRQGFLMFFAHGCELVYKVVRPDINEVSMFCRVNDGV